MPRWNAPALETLFELASEHGDVVPIPAFGVPLFMFCHPDHIEEILRQKSRSFKKGCYLDALRPLLGNGLFTSEGETWRRQRAAARPLFAAQQIQQYAATMVECTERFLAGWQRGETRHLHADLMALTLDIVIKTLFDVDADDAGALGEELDALTEWHTDPKTVWSSVEGRDVPAAADHLSPRLDALIFDMIHERRERGIGNRTDLLSRMLAADEAAGQKTSDFELRDQLITYFLAGQETTALTLFYSFFLLAQNPDAERHLQTELKSVLGDRLPAADDLERLPYSEAVVNESMRLYPPAWAIGREALEDCEIGGHPVPKGAQVLMSQFLVQHDPRFWPDPERFDPSRWNEERTKDLPRCVFFPFGDGPRACIGGNFAMMEAVLVLATIARRFRLDLVPGQTLHLVPSLTLRPRDEIHMVLR
jgi:cytochrome P450